MAKLHIRTATVSDLLVLQKIGRQTFTETFAAVNSPENLARYLEKSFSLDKLNVELSTTASAFYFAEDDGHVIGYLKINVGKTQTELKDELALEIERIYVLEQYHGKKVGQLLYEKAIEVAEKMGKKYVWLGVWEENKRALQFYRKNGFAEFDKHIFKLGDDEQTDIMMKLELT
jgi:ribosomal protein S18 acetylase RimI-like enzyme